MSRNLQYSKPKSSNLACTAVAHKQLLGSVIHQGVDSPVLNLRFNIINRQRQRFEIVFAYLLPLPPRQRFPKRLETS